ncbi:hypothetical protein [Paenibacillus luteus]|uniref:hypothetical protein n=1 Tax=Paenibacillus luteus TaxID=2545753 RepID=UPI0011448855|nr:hypothetical protein [Paenibacillus luteus]
MKYFFKMQVIAAPSVLYTLIFFTLLTGSSVPDAIPVFGLSFFLIIPAILAYYFSDGRWISLFYSTVHYAVNMIIVLAILLQTEFFTNTSTNALLIILFSPVPAFLLLLGCLVGIETRSMHQDPDTKKRDPDSASPK